MNFKQERQFKETEIGLIPEDWNLIMLKDTCSKIGSGITPRGGADVYSKEGTALIRSQNVLNNSFSYDGLVYLSQDLAEEMENVTVAHRDVLLNITGDSVARCCTVPDNILPARVNQHVSIIRTNEKELEPFFLKYYLTSPKMQNYMLSLAQSGGTRNALTKGMIENFVIPKPAINEQKVIVDILSALDSKIELNSYMNRTLEAVGESLFKHWFVDFEFPNQEGKPYKSTGGKMVESDLGEIPHGWHVRQLRDFGKVVCGKTPPKSVKSFFGGNIPFIKIPDMHNQLFIIQTEDSLTHEGESFQANKTVPVGTICVSCIATVGLVSLTSKESQTNQQINCVMPKREFYKYYLFFTMKSMGKELNDLGSGGSATLNVNTNAFSSIQIIEPEESVVREYHRLIEPLLSKAQANLFENHTLTEIRDRLLSKIMSGKIRIPINNENLEAT